MDGRWKQLLAGGVLCGLVGCSSLRDKNPSSPSGSTVEPPLNMSSSKSFKADSQPKDNTPLKIETLLAFANTHMQAAASKDRSEKERDASLQSARIAYEEILKREPKNLDATLGMARSYKQMGEKGLCVEWYERATRAYPANASVWGEMGQALDGLKDHNRAIRCYQKATELDPVNKTYRKALGLAWAYSRQYKEAFELLRRAMPEPEAHVCLARMADHNGDRDIATEQFALAFQADPKNQTARLAIDDSAPVEPSAGDSAVQTVGFEQYTTLQAAALTKSSPVPAAIQMQPQPSNQDPTPVQLSTPAPSAPARPVAPSSQGWVPVR